MNILLIFLFVCPPTYLSYFLLKKSRFDLTNFEAVSISLFLGQYFLIAIAFLSALIVGFSNIQILSIILVIIAIDVALVIKSKPRLIPLDGGQAFLVTSLLLTIIFTVLLQRHMLPEIDQQLFTGYTTYGDLPMHLGMITTMAKGDNFPPQNPLFPPLRLAYPFFINFYSAILYKLGLSIQDSLIIPSAIFGLNLFSLFLILAKQYLKSTAAAILGLILFLFSCGLGGYYVLADALQKPNFLPGLNQALQADVGVGRYNLIFTGNFSSVLLAQRSLVPGLAAFFLVSLFLWRSTQRNSKKELALAGLVAGLLPFWHTHSLIALAIIFPCLLILLSLRSRQPVKIVRQFIPFLVTFLPLASLGLLWHFGQVLSGNHFVSLKIGWIIGPEGPLVFWWRNLSIFLIILPFGYYLLDKNQRFFYLPFLVLLLLVHVIQFQPLIYDNYKLVMIWHALSAIIVALALVRFYQHNSLSKVVVKAAVLFLVLSGVILAIADYAVIFSLFGREEIQLAKWQQQNTPPDSLFVTAPLHNQFSVLGGRKILLGSPGYIWVHGIDSNARQQEIRSIYQGNLALLIKYHHPYVVVSRAEIEAYQPNLNYLDQSLSLVYSTAQYRIYQPIKP